MRRTWVPTTLILLLAALAVPAAAAPRVAVPTAPVTSDAVAALLTAAKAPAVTYTGLQNGRYATVYNEGGTKHAVIDQTVQGAPKGQVVIDGVVMAQLGLSYIDIIPPDGVVMDEPTAGKPPISPPVTVGPIAPPRGGVGVQSLKDWHDDWAWTRDLSSGYDRINAEGELAYGCENASDDTVMVDCTLTTTAQYQQTGSFRLDIQKVVQLGFDIGHTDTKTIALTVKSIPPWSLYYVQPMVQRYGRYWAEVQHHYQCERSWTWFGCVSGTTRQIHTHDNSGEAHKARVLYGRLVRESTN